MAALTTIAALSAIAAAGFQTFKSATQKAPEAPTIPTVPAAPTAPSPAPAITNLSAKAPLPGSKSGRASTLLTATGALDTAAVTERKTLLGS